MEELIVGTQSSQKEDKVKIIKASILDKGARKYWYIRYQISSDNNMIGKKEESSKVLKTEKNRG